MIEKRAQALAPLKNSLIKIKKLTYCHGNCFVAYSRYRRIQPPCLTSFPCFDFEGLLDVRTFIASSISKMITNLR